MCQPSKVTADWVVKGCHIHVGEVELVVFPNHQSGVGLRPFFKMKRGTEEQVLEALRVAEQECLRDPLVRKHWIRSLNQAITYMLSVSGELAFLARGRMAEFKFLRIALERFEE